MARVIIEILGHSSTRRNYRIFEQQEICIGRGYHNDLILSDPYVSSEHLVIAGQDSQWVVKDRDSKNGVFVAPHFNSIKKKEIVSGDVITIGRTRLRFILDDHPVAPTKVLARQNKFFQEVSKTFVAWGFVLILALSFFIESYFQYSEKIKIEKLIPLSLAMVILSIVIAGVWGFVGSLIKHRTKFNAQLSTISLFFIVQLYASSIIENISYLLNSFEFEVVGKIAVFFFSASIALIWSLGFATNISKKKRIIASNTLMSILLFIVLFIYFVFRDEFNPVALYHTTLKPPAIKVVKRKTIEQFIVQSNKVFVEENKE